VPVAESERGKVEQAGVCRHGEELGEVPGETVRVIA